MKKWLLILVGGVALLVVLVLVIGAMLPREHSASRSAVYQRPPGEVWEAITGVDAMPEWRSDVDRVEHLPHRDGNPVWQETGTYGSMPMEQIEAVPRRRLVLRIADPALPFGGTWTYELEPADGGTRLTITEDGHVDNVVFRFMSRFVFGYTSTMEGYLRDLGRHFGEEIEVQPGSAPGTAA